MSDRISLRLICQELKLSPRAILRLMREGKFPATVEEGVYVWDLDEFQEWYLEQLEKGITPELDFEEPFSI